MRIRPACWCIGAALIIRAAWGGPPDEKSIVRRMGQNIEIQTSSGDIHQGRLIWMNREFLTLKSGGTCDEVWTDEVAAIHSVAAPVSSEERVGSVLGGAAMMAVLLPVLAISKVVDPHQKPRLVGSWESTEAIRPRIYVRVDFGAKGEFTESTEGALSGSYEAMGDTLRLAAGDRRLEFATAFHCGTLVMDGREYRRFSPPSIHDPAIAGIWCSDAQPARVCFRFAAAGGSFEKRVTRQARTGTYNGTAKRWRFSG